MFKIQLVIILIIIQNTYAFRLGAFGHATKEFNLGGGNAFQEAEHSEEGEEGEKGYAGHHAAANGQTGHHDIAGEKKSYAEKGGNKKGESHDDGYHQEKHRAEKGEKGYEYADKGSYSKGHSTKGHHNVHKLNEFKKKTDFYDEDHDEAYKESHGGYEQGIKYNSGENKKSGHSNIAVEQGDFGKAGNVEKEIHSFADSGYKKDVGRDSFHKSIAEIGKELDSEDFRNYGYKH